MYNVTHERMFVMANIKKRMKLPLIPVRGIIIFPYMILHFDVARKKSIAALEAAMADHQHVFLTAQSDVSIEHPTPDDFYDIGTVAKVKQLLKLPGNGVRILVEGLYRAKLVEITSEVPFFECETLELRSTKKSLTPIEEEASVRMLNRIFEDYFNLNPRISPDTFRNISTIDDSGQFADTIASNFILKIEDKQSILSELDVAERLKKLIAIMTSEIDVLNAENSIMSQVQSRIAQNQREYFLREQMQVISKELGDDDSNEAKEFEKRIIDSNLPEEAEKKAYKELARLNRMSPQSAERSVVINYLDTLLDMPYGIKTEENSSITRAAKILNADHYGLKKVKERILEYLSVRNLSGGIGGQILCLVGPPGVGKTSIARSIGEALGRNYVRVSLGGVRDEADIRGHRKTYVGSMPGRIVNAIKLAGSSNALVLLDEVDKLGSDFKGDPSSALLEVLDPEQNFAFRDHYLEVPFDLSDVMFITTANNPENIPAPLYDRMEIIQLSGYTSEEKLHIAMNHLVPKNIKKHGLTTAQMRLRHSAVEDIIDYYTREAGVRSLEREIAHLCRRVAKQIVSGAKTVTVTSKNLESFLGPHKFRRETLSYKEDIGIVRGLAWTAVGGDTLSIEVNVMNGDGKTELTGSLGDVMKESAKAAISYIRTRADELGIKKDFHKKYDIHLHVPEGAVPKDGPSAGITIATAMISALSCRPVRGDIAMTGEITLRGRILPVGGITEKLLAAFRYGIKTVLIPMDNVKDLEEIPQNIKEQMKIIPVSDMDEVASFVLMPKKDSQSLPDMPIEISVSSNCSAAQRPKFNN